jgi:hypothetical protein
MRRKPWTRRVAAAAVLLALAGCSVGIRYAAVGAHDAAGARPHPSYYCYDCHGYRYFDPYYDWCAGYGFRYRWNRHPEVTGLYRARYLEIRETHPEYGRYRYRAGYRENRRYRQPPSYEGWKERVEGRAGGREKVRENPPVPVYDGRL